MSSNYALDEVLDERVLFDGKALAGTGLERTEEKTSDGFPLLRWPAGLGAVELAPPFDLAGYDEIAVECNLAEGAGTKLSLHLDMATRTPGLGDNDSSWDWASLGTSARQPVFGFQEARFDLEDCHFYGTPIAWQSVEKTGLTRTPPVDLLVGRVLARHRRRPPGPRLSDVGFFAALDLERPELAEVARNVASGNLPGAARALSDHYRARSEPRHFYPRKLPVPSGAELGRLLADDIMGCAFDGGVDWRANPFGYLEWRHAFNRHFFFRGVLAAYLKGGDERCAAKLDEWLRSWIAASPAPVRTGGGGDPAWETLSTACRIYGSWLDVFFGTLRSSNFSDSTRLAVLKSLHAHAEHLLHHSVVAGNNWLVVESQALASIGLLFPEFKSAETWRKAGFERLTAEVTRQIYPDGADWELSPGYHAMAARGFAEPMELARLNDFELPAVYEERVRGAFGFSLGILRPDGTAPAPNDSGGIGGRQTDWLAYGARLLDDEHLRWGATAGAEGRPPEYASVAFEDAGYYVTRSGWDADARWLLFDGGPLGFSHVHEDKLSFELAAFGKLFIADPGIASYQHDPWTRFYRRTEAHSTILVDGRGQDRKRAQSKEEQCRSVRGENLWCAGQLLDAAAAEYRAGYEGLEGNFLHRRRVLFVRPDYWLIADEVEGEGQHDLAALFHFTPMQLAAEADTGRVRSERLELPNLEIVPVPAGAAPKPRIVCGARDPVQGWAVFGAGRGRENLPAPTAIYEARAALPWRCAWLLIPFTGRTVAAVEVRAVEAQKGSLAFECRFPDGRSDLVFLRWGAHGTERDPLRFGEFSTDGWAATVRRDAGGGLVRAAAVAARCLQGPGIDLGRPAPALVETEL